MRSLCPLVLVSLLALDARAAEVYLDVRGFAAVTPEELAEAVAARATLARERGAGVQVITVMLEPDLALVVAADGRAQRVALGGRAGPAAARVVAIGVIDLVARLPAVPAPREGDATLALWPAASLGGGGAVELGGAIDLSTRVAFLRAGVTVELSRGSFHVGQVDFTSSYVGLTLRAGAGLRRGPLELRAGPLLSVERVSGGAGHTDVRAGGAALGLAALPLSRELSLVIAAGADVYARRTEYFVQGYAGRATPRVRPWAGVGLALGWRR